MTSNNNGAASILGIILLLVLAIAISYGATIFIYWLITLCFGITWTLAHATGVWLAMLLVSTTIGTSGIKLKLGNNN